MGEVILELKNIHKSFGTNKIHRGINLSLKKGESLGLLGGSGTGKSVLLRSIIGLERIDQGEILFHGERIDQLSEEELTPYRIKISYSFQSGALFDSINVFENIGYPLFEHTRFSYQQIKDKVAEMLKLIDLPGREHIMPSDLSGGMQKRVGMARAMILNPEVILYDEPTAGLDPANTLNVVGLMQRLKEKGLASIFVTHDIPSALSLCDRIVVLNEGKIIFNDTPTNFQNSDDPIVKKFNAH
ncbi:ATP-binding cassette domain-containing protein [Bacteriovorax sp. PP10]|uniref:ATP-binding cassette domain-containing protein n=1 Tax=Bacteriovorax antarcticus TaxID=3088717 RepID=A0ABU5VUS1_9BACT|nr:ATP-binding cassette domain-containing protein [Bacteriovorax sp. PP10]MEA9356797.1 ATP-binding cassette domain-containing protein [Bacteriovorax sp. PP10]